MVVRLAILLLLTSCATPIDELLATATACGNGPECADLWGEVNRREAQILRRERENANPCPQGYIYLNDSQFGASCITPGQLRQLF